MRSIFRPVISATLLALLTTTASAQLLLPPAPPTNAEVQTHNWAAIAVYVSTCKRDNPAYQPEQGWMWGVIWGAGNDFPISYAEPLLKGARDVARSYPSIADYCAAADQDQHMQAVLRRLEVQFAYLEKH